MAELSDAPLVATHSNAHALSPHSRNLTDKQLTAIRETGGMVGVNFAVSFLRADGRQDSDTPVELIIDHVEHMLKQVGEDGVGFGSDFDGAMIPKELGNAAGLPALVEVMRHARLRRAADREAVLPELAAGAGADVELIAAWTSSAHRSRNSSEPGDHCPLARRMTRRLTGTASAT